MRHADQVGRVRMQNDSVITAQATQIIMHHQVRRQLGSINSKGEWLEIDCKNKSVPSTFIPQAISKYMKANYNGHKTVKIERNRKGYELTLENGLEVDFDQFGGFLKLSD